MTSTTVSVTEIADAIEGAERSGIAIPQFGDAMDLDRAYEVQAQLLARRLSRGERFVGAKLGFTSEAKMVQMGVSEVIVGFLTDRMQIESGGVLSLEGLVHPRVEPEIAFRLGSPVGPGDSAEDLLAAVDAVAPALEVIDSRFEAFSFSLSDVVADNTSACRFVVGEWSPFSHELADRSVELKIDGRTAEKGAASAILGDPLRALDRLAGLAERYDIDLPAGAVILAGAATAAVRLLPGMHVLARVGGLGSVSLQISTGFGR
jgi:2-oxo-3-hexenedioate decarboxylase